MRFANAFCAALSLGVFLLPVDAFVVPSRTSPVRRRTVVRKVSEGWGNDDFLDALSGGKKAIEKVNERYEEQRRYQDPAGSPEGVVPAESLSQRSTRPQQRAPPPPPAAADPPMEGMGEPGASQGGSRFQQMMQTSQERGSPHAPGYDPYATPPPIPPPPPVGDAGYDDIPVVNATPEQAARTKMMEEEQRRYREYVYQQQQQDQPITPPMPPTTERTLSGPKRAGRNRDADSINNMADLYLAQLKRDSTVRVQARQQGDVETANKPMADESVEELKNLIRVNPYLQAEKIEKQKELIAGTSEDEMLLPLKPKPEPEKSYAGISYREKLKQLKKKKSGAPAAKQESTPFVTKKPVATVAPEPVQESPEKTIEPEVAETAPVQAAAVVEPPTERVSPPATGTALPSWDAEETRRNIRSLMGLILKHRGGPGFGAGRLKAPEAKRYADLLGEVTALLRSEAGIAPAASTPVAPVQETPVESKPAAPADVQAEAPKPAAPAGTSSKMTGAIACVEAAVKMYKESVPEAKESLLVPLRAALMSAVNACNQAIAENEVANVESYRASVPQPPVEEPAPSQTMGFPSSYTVIEPEVEPTPPASMGFPSSYAVTQPEEVNVVRDVAATRASDANTELLSKVSDALKAAAGDEKLGLKRLDPTEGESLADQLLEMRNVLMEELDSGIPSAPSPPQPPAVSQDTKPVSASSSSSKYQQVLAKAQAAKATKRSQTG